MRRSLISASLQLAFKFRWMASEKQRKKIPTSLFLELCAFGLTASTFTTWTNRWVHHSSLDHSPVRHFKRLFLSMVVCLCQSTAKATRSWVVIQSLETTSSLLSVQYVLKMPREKRGNSGWNLSLWNNMFLCGSILPCRQLLHCPYEL